MYPERSPPFPVVHLSQVALYSMSIQKRTDRMEVTWPRSPRRQQERRQLRGLQTDQTMWGVDISPRNRLNRQIQDEWYDWRPSSKLEDYVN